MAEESASGEINILYNGIYFDQIGCVRYNVGMDIAVGDIVQTRKKHPCGGDAWTVIRVGMDIKLRCKTCGRIVMLERAECLKRIKKIIESPSGDAQ